MILDRILANKYSEVAQRRSATPIESLRDQVLAQTPPRDFIGALKQAGRPALIAECAEAIGNQNIVLSMDIKTVAVSAACPSGYEIVIHGGRKPMGIDALAWALEGERLGAGELVINSIDADGTRAGYAIELTRMLSEAVRIPVIASGGAGKPEHLYDALTKGKADAVLVASMVHYGDYHVSELKTYLHGRGVKMRMSW